MAALLSLILFALLPTHLIRFEIFGIPSTLLEVSIYAAVVILLIYMLVTRTRIRWRHPLLPAVVLIVLGAVIGTLVAPDQRAALGLLKGYIADPILVSFLIVQIPRERLALPWWGYSLSAAALGAWGIVQWLGQLEPGFRAAGPFESPNYLALYLGPAIPFLMIMLVRLRGWARGVSGVLLTLVVASLGVTVSRGAHLSLLAAVVVVAAIFSFTSLRGARRLSTLALLLALLVSGAYAVSQSVGGRAESSDSIRVWIWRSSVEMIQEQPLTGIGLAAFETEFIEREGDKPNFASAVTAHNIYLNIWLNLGLAGLAGLLLAAFLSLRAGLRGFPAPLALAGSLSLIVILVHGLVDTSIWKNDLFAIFWLAVLTPILAGQAGASNKQKTISNKQKKVESSKQ